jgi:hypothetical protein
MCVPPGTTCVSCTGSLSGAARQPVGWTRRRRTGPEMPEEGPAQAVPGAGDAHTRPDALIAGQPLTRHEFRCGTTYAILRSGGQHL